MSKDNIIKIGFTDASLVRQISAEEFETKFASESVVNRLNKFANTVRAIAPRSDDFLYFSIIFLKAAESAIIDELGNNKKVGKENAWGHFDENWRWHGNVKAHKNSNNDIFPESELKKAARKWIGKPLCVDHKSDSVDGVRGIILDTYYDEKYKQVVGLCALDKVNYPDLARKVSTGVVRYGSMGTAVSTSICTECGTQATTPKEYCSHILNRQAWGEINVGLNPIEYSLVVQPAEPGAILLRCFASINKHKDELKSYGFDVTSLKQSMDDKTANDLDILLNKVCANDSCSLEQRERIIRGYLSTSGFSKSASINNKSAKIDKIELAKAMADFAAATGKTMTESPDLFKQFFKDELVDGDELSLPLGETLTSGQSVSGSETITMKDDHDVSDYTGTGSSGMVSSVSEPNPNSFKGDGVGPERYAFSSIKESNVKLSSILEDIMDKTTLKRRANLRRRLAHPQGGAAPEMEPNTFVDEGEASNKIREEEDKQMKQTDSMGGTDGMVPGDKEMKEKLLRAEDKALNSQKRAYYLGGAHPEMEPATFVSEDYTKYWDLDKNMLQGGSMGGADGMFPGDKEMKEKISRAKYNGPALSTKLKQRRRPDGSINKAASAFEVYSGGKLVVATTAGEIFGEKLDSNWNFLTSKEYAKAVIAAIREDGLRTVARNLTKNAQEMVMPEADVISAPDETMMTDVATEDMAAPTEMPQQMPEDMPEQMTEEDMDEDVSEPKEVIEGALVSMEDTIEKIREALSELGGGEDMSVVVNLEEPVEETVVLSKSVFNELKTVLADAKESADELAMVAEAYDKYSSLSSAQKKDVRTLSNASLNDYASIVGQSKALISVAKTLASSMVKVSEYKEEPAPNRVVKEASASSGLSDLESAALNLRKQRRQRLLKEAEKKLAMTTEMDEACADDTKVVSTEGVGVDMYHVKELAESEAREEVEKHELRMHSDDEEEEEHEESEESEESEEEMEEDEESSVVASKLTERFISKKADEEREAYKIKLRRAYDIAMEMQRKGMIAKTRPELNRQVDEIMEFDNKAFEAFKRSVASFKGHENIVTASDLGGINVGVNNEDEQVGKKADGSWKQKLASLWDND